MMSFLDALFDERISTSAVPIAVFVWLVQLIWSTRNRRLDESRLAVVYLNEIIKEVSVGTDRLRGLYMNGGTPDLSETGTFHPRMPTACWYGIRDILPDDIFHRICFVAAHDGKEEMVRDLRWHLKNYYTVICEYGNKLLLQEDGVQFEKNVVRAHLDGAKMVEDLLGKTSEMMSGNLKRIIWPR